MKTIKVDRFTSSFHLEEVITKETYEIEVEDDFDKDEEDLWEVMADYVDDHKQPVSYEYDNWWSVNDIDKYQSIDDLVESAKDYKLDDQHFEISED